VAVGWPVHPNASRCYSVTTRYGPNIVLMLTVLASCATSRLGDVGVTECAGRKLSYFASKTTL